VTTNKCQWIAVIETSVLISSVITKSTTDFAGIKVNVTMTLIIYNNAEENAIGNRRKKTGSRDAGQIK